MDINIFDTKQLVAYESTQSQTAVPILCLDFDGVLHSFEQGWTGSAYIPGDAIPGAMEFLVKAVQHFQVHIYSNRCNLPGGIYSMQWWLIRQIQIAFKHIMTDYDAGCIVSQLWFDMIKPPAFVTIDDRAIQFKGIWPDVEVLTHFKPWYQQPAKLDLTPTQVDMLLDLIKTVDDVNCMTDTELAQALDKLWSEYDLTSKASWVLLEASERLAGKERSNASTQSS